MREILFRGYNKETGQWYYGMLDKFDGKYFINDGSGTKAYVDEESIGQYTSFTDKNGKKIFEGDIVKFDKSKERYEIIFKEHIGQYRARGLNENVDDRLFQFFLFGCEVIGSKYKNELEDFVNE